MKKLIIFIAALLICSLTLSCGKSEEMIVIDTFGMGFGDFLYDTESLQGAVESSHLIIKGKIIELANLDYSDVSDVPLFLYNVEIEKIYYDRDNLHSEKDIIKFNTLCGYLKANDYKEAVGNRPRAKKYNYLADSYGDNEYFRFTDFGELAYEIGKEYILCLYTTGSVTDPERDYGPASSKQMYEVNSSKLTNTYKSNSVTTLSSLEKDIAECIKNRTGERDIRYSNY